MEIHTAEIRHFIFWTALLTKYHIFIVDLYSCFIYYIVRYIYFSREKIPHLA